RPETGMNQSATSKVGCHGDGVGCFGGVQAHDFRAGSSGADGTVEAGRVPAGDLLWCEAYRLGDPNGRLVAGHDGLEYPGPVDIDARDGAGAEDRRDYG